VSKVTNTAKDEQHPEWTLGGNPGAIKAQEARGQQELVNAAVLPAECSADDRTALEAAGVVFGDPVEGDDLFINVTLPEGWKKQATDHAMWSELLDAEGKVRANIFYKAAFYDRRADMYVPRER
jgi:hypothetical protein